MLYIYILYIHVCSPPPPLCVTHYIALCMNYGRGLSLKMQIITNFCKCQHRQLIFTKNSGISIIYIYIYVKNNVFTTITPPPPPPPLSHPSNVAILWQFLPIHIDTLYIFRALSNKTRL